MAFPVPPSLPSITSANFPELLDMEKGSIPRTRESALIGKLFFMEYPTREKLRRYTILKNSCIRPPNPPAEPVFVGQLPSGLPVAVVAWAVDMLLGKYSVQWMSQRKEVFANIWVANQEDQRELILCSGTLLFDLSGIWFVDPRGLKELQGLQKQWIQQHVDEIQERRISVDPRLPRRPIVFELPRESSRNKAPLEKGS